MIPQETKPSITLPDIPALCLDAKAVHVLSAEGELQSLPYGQAVSLIHQQAVMVCHAPYVRGRLGRDAAFYAFDLLELFAFVHPARFATPTVGGLCSALGLAPPESFEDAPMSMMEIARALLSDLQNDVHAAKAPPAQIARVMGLNGNGWGWTPFVLSALGEEYEPALPVNAKADLNVWKHLPEWAEEAPEGAASQHPVTAEEAEARLSKLLGAGAEQRVPQVEYASKVTHAFSPPPHEEVPNIILAEAGTGVGKTLGYLAPASVWAEKNQGSVWISTYTKNLQRQIDQELDKLYPNPAIKAAHVATRKGRENYLCLLNLEEHASGAALAKNPQAVVAAGIMARWAVASKDGDLTGAEYPGWLTSILGYQYSRGLSDRRGECVYSACDHYSKCFVEHSVRAAVHARIVVANHALVMINAAIATSSEELPHRYVFDEGHHLFDAADSAFAAHLTAREARDLRRWILGNEGGRRGSRARGLKRRAEDLCEGMSDAEEALRQALSAAEILPMDGWTRRLRDNAPMGACEKFMAALYAQAYARADGRDGPYSLETGVFPVDEPLAAAAVKLKGALVALQKPMLRLSRALYKKLADDDGKLSGDTRNRLESVSQSIERRARLTIGAWIAMLESMAGAGEQGEAQAQFVDWLEIERVDGRAVDVGYYRHYVDPMKPFAESIKPHVHGMAVTSATLRDAEAWDGAIGRSGARYLTPETQVAAFESPFDYAQQTKIFVIDDVNKNDMRLVAKAYQSLFEASGGSALGLFTAISRLRAVHNYIAAGLEEGGIPLYSQHVDDIDAGTLVDMFKEDARACLLGTDAIRDGVDVPGESLRLIVFDRVPWPRPTILHKARRQYYGGRGYDESLTRLKLKQAFGRLIRRNTDQGVFVMLDSMLPSRLQDAFPKEVEVQKVGLAEAIAQMTLFFDRG
ncbi:MAG: ATP-dependent DNA helicase [Alphaproteobacteria bacterium]